jgi:obg-like ATPase 1
MLNVTDIAGLVKGASEGAGLGNAFLSHIQAIDGIFHMLRGFEGKEVTHVDGSVDPIKDMGTIADELLLKDIKTLGDKIAVDKKAAERGGAGAKELKKALDCIVKAKAFAEDMDGAREIRFGPWNFEEVQVLNGIQLLTAKPVCFLVNLTKKAYLTQKSKWLGPVGNHIKERGTGELIIPWSGRFEEDLVEAEVNGGQDAVDAFLKENGDAVSALPRIIKTGYAALGLVSFFTSGKDEVRQWTVRSGRTAPQAAGVIHTDFEKGFIMAETYGFKDIKKLGDEAAVKKAGKYRQEGKKYIVQDGDIFFFKFNN